MLEIGWPSNMIVVFFKIICLEKSLQKREMKFGLKRQKGMGGVNLARKTVGKSVKFYW